MQPFDYVRAKDVDEVVSILASHGEQARVMSGGTDLIVAMREGRRQAKVVVDIKGLAETSEISYSPHTGLRLGAAVPCYRVYGDEQVASAYPGLIDSARLIGGVQIQGRASLGGNVCNASPAADSIPALIVHSAACVVAGPHGRRNIAIEDFFVGAGKTVLQTGEFLVSFLLAPPPPGFGAAYLRFTPRNEMDIAVVGAGASVILDETRTVIRSARIALGAVAPTPLFVAAAGEALAGQPAGAEAVERAASLAQAAATPITDMRGTVEYRKHLSAVLTRRALNAAIARAKAA